MRASRPLLSKQAGVCSDGQIENDINVVGDCIPGDTCESGCRISAEMSLPINGIYSLSGEKFWGIPQFPK